MNLSRSLALALAVTSRRRARRHVLAAGRLSLALTPPTRTTYATAAVPTCMFVCCIICFLTAK